MSDNSKRNLSVRLDILKSELERVHGLPARVEQDSDTTAWVFVESFADDEYLYAIDRAIEILQQYPDNYAQQGEAYALDVTIDLEDNGGYLFKVRNLVATSFFLEPDRGCFSASDLERMRVKLKELTQYLFVTAPDAFVICRNESDKTRLAQGPTSEDSEQMNSVLLQENSIFCTVVNGTDNRVLQQFALWCLETFDCRYRKGISGPIDTEAWFNS